MSAKDKTFQEKQVDMAIRSLYSRFPRHDIKYGCRNVKTHRIMAIARKVKAREKVLKNDSQLASLHKELCAEQCRTIKAANEQHARVDVLLRAFQTRGVTEQVLNTIDRMSVEEPAVIDMCMCTDDDD